MNLLSTAFHLILISLTGCIAKLPYIIKYNCETNAPIRPEWLNYMIPEHNYTHLLPPNPDGCPTYVRVDIVPFTIGRVSIPDMTFDMDLYVGLIWEDIRLDIPGDFDFEIGLDAETAASIWTPVVDFRNSHSSSLIKFDPDKDKLKIKGRRLFFYVRRFAKFHCNFDISLYPMDQQLCFIEVQAVGDERDTVILLDHVHYYDLLSNSIPTEFSLSKFSSGTCQRPDFTAPELTCIEYRFILTRRCGDHYLMSYMPSILVVILSWLSFWIDATSIGCRLAIGFAAMLTMIAHFSIELKEIPPVSYVKAIDVWIFGCLFIIFLSVIEVCAANAVVKQKKKKLAHLRRTQELKSSSHQAISLQPRNWDAQWGIRRRDPQIAPYVSQPEEYNAAPDNPAPPNFPPVESVQLTGIFKSEGRHEEIFQRTNTNSSLAVQDLVMDLDNIIDKVARIVFPLMFIIFNICYWSYYQSKEITLPQEVD